MPLLVQKCTLKNMLENRRLYENLKVANNDTTDALNQLAYSLQYELFVSTFHAILM